MQMSIIRGIFGGWRASPGQVTNVREVPDMHCSWVPPEYAPDKFASKILIFWSWGGQNREVVHIETLGNVAIVRSGLQVPHVQVIF